MKIKKAEFIVSAVGKKQYPPADIPEIAFAGRSNVGKSSLINLLTGRKSLAKVSSNPGKTRTINFFDINNGEFRVVDLPGYGFAKTSKSVQEDWGPMMENYLSKRENLVRVIQLVDCRIPPTAKDIQMYEWLRYYDLAGTIVATKADKLSRNEMNRSISVIKKTLDLGPEDKIFPVSALKRTGTDELMAELSLLLGEE